MEETKQSTPALARATKYSAGHELRTTEDIRLTPGERQFYPVGVRLDIPEGYYMLVKSRSSIAARGVDVGAGVIDADYKGEIKVLLCNNGSRTFEAKEGDSIAQGILAKYEVLDNSTVIKPDAFEHLGFGSTN